MAAHSRVPASPTVSLTEEAAAAQAAAGGDLRIAQAVEIVTAYARLLEDGARQRGIVADAGALPYPKETIKWALLVLMAAIPEAARREALRAGFVALSEWQVHADFAAGFDSTRLRRRIDPLALAKEFAAARTPEDRWNAAAREDQAALVEELRRRGLW